VGSKRDGSLDPDILNPPGAEAEEALLGGRMSRSPDV